MTEITWQRNENHKARNWTNRNKSDTEKIKIRNGKAEAMNETQWIKQNFMCCLPEELKQFI